MKTACNKDTGGKRRLQKCSRGSWFCISGGVAWPITSFNVALVQETGRMTIGVL